MIQQSHFGYFFKRIEIRILVFTVALFTIASMWKQPSKWVEKEKVVYTYNGISFSLKKKEILQYVTTWMKLEHFMLREISQLQKDKHCIIPLT